MTSPWLRYAVVVALISCDGTLGVLVPPYLKDQGYDFAAIGFLVALTGVAALASRVPAGALYRRDRSRYILAGALVGEGLVAWFFPILEGPVAIGIAQAVIGFSFGVAGTTNLAMLMDLVPAGGSRHRAMGYYAACLSAGHMAGSLFGGLGADRFGYEPGFKMAAGFAALALVFLLVDRTSVLPRPNDVSQVSKPSLPLVVRLKALTEPRVVILSLVALLLNFFQGVLMTFFPLFALEAGLTLSELGIARSAHSLVNTITRPIAGPAITRLGVERVCFGGLAILSAVTAVMPLVPYFWPMLIAFVLTGLLRSLVLVANTIGIADLDETRISRGMASSVYNSAKDVGNLISPTLCGALAAAVGLGAMLVSVPIGAAVVVFGVVALNTSRAHPIGTAEADATARSTSEKPGRS
ncbi:MAG: MFS transporter [Chloroflexota bacterium]